MAILHSFGLPEEIRRMNLLAEEVRPTAERLLKEAGDITVRATQIAAETYGLRKTGQMIESITYDEPHMYSDSALLEVWPKGKRRPKGRNAEVGFIQEYGRSYGRKERAGVGFFDDGYKYSDEEAHALWAQGWSDFIDQRG